MSTESALSFCTELVRAHDYDRYLCAMFAPETARAGLMAVYAFNQEIAMIRDVITEPVSGHIRLQWWREAVDTIYAGGNPEHQVTVASAGTVERFALSRTHFDRLIGGPGPRPSHVLAETGQAAGRPFDHAEHADIR